MDFVVISKMDVPFPSFQLHEFIPPDGFSGRNCGSELDVGMAFICLRRTRYTGDKLNLESEEAVPPRQINLLLEKIEAYGASLDDLYSGMTAVLRVSGDGIRELAEELAALPKREYLSIEKPTGDNKSE